MYSIGINNENYLDYKSLPPTTTDNNTSTSSSSSSTSMTTAQLQQRRVQRYIIYERALKVLPMSYKLWMKYLNERMVIITSAPTYIDIYTDM